MKQKRHTTDQIISKLRRADVQLGKGRKVPEVCKGLEITQHELTALAAQIKPLLDHIRQNADKG